jgi:hypothetical protein
MFQKKSLFVFIDESGNFDFSPTGTGHLVLTAVICFRPMKSAATMLNLKYFRYSRGLNSPQFHASHDRLATRLEVFNVISSIKSIKSFTAVITKPELSGQVVRPADIYHSFGVELAEHLRTVTKRRKVVIVFDKALKAREEDALVASLKSHFSQQDRDYLIYFHNVSKDPNAQIADYIAWANFGFFEKGNSHWLEKLPNRLSASRKLTLRA